MIDVYAERNPGKRDIYRHCELHKIKKIVQDRIYACCVVFGQALRQGFSPETVSVPFDENWRENLARVNVEEHCRRCCVDVNAPMAPWWRLKQVSFRKKSRSPKAPA